MPSVSSEYGRDLASIHHQGFGWAAAGASKTLLYELRRRRLREGLVVDLGSGSGTFARRLNDAGYDVLGVELSAAMVRIARQEAPKARFIRASIKDFEPPPCIAVSGIGEVLNYEFDRRTSLVTLKRVFSRVHRALVPGGAFLFDLSGPGRGGPSGVIEKIFEGDGYSMFIRATEDERRRLLTRDHIAFVRAGERYKRIEERHLLRLFEPSKIIELLRTAGFTVRRLPGYPGGPKLLGWQVFLAGKRAH